MKYVGVDLHKHLIVLCVVVLVAGRPKVVRRARFRCGEPGAIRAFFEELGPFQVVVEATAAYEWFFLLIEDSADRLVLAHPKKLRVIAESARKSDKIDAEVLGVFLALDMIPEAYRPTPRIRQHRVLTRHRCWLPRRITSLKCKVRNVLGHYNADIAGLFARPRINTGSRKKAIVGVARHLLCLMQAMLQSSRPYELLGVPNGNQQSTIVTPMRLRRKIFQGMARVSHGVKNKAPSRVGGQGPDAPWAHPRPGYPWSGCVPAEPDSVSPGRTKIPWMGCSQQAPLDTRVVPQKIPGRRPAHP